MEPRTGPPCVSVIMPTYNRARFVREAIRSALDQTLTDLEVIAIDDGSTDNTSETIAAIEDPRLHHVSIAHRGVSGALNAGLCKSRGRYIARLDSDDVWVPEALATLVAVLEAQPEVGVAYGKGSVIDVEGGPIEHIRGMALPLPDDALRSLLVDDCTCNVALVARRECFERVGGYDESLLANEDWDMWLRIARHYRFVFVDCILVSIRWHGDNLTGLNSPHLGAVLDQRTVPLDKLFSDSELALSILAMKSIAYSNVHSFRCLRRLQRREFGLAAKEFTSAVRFSERPFYTAARIAWRAIVVPRLNLLARRNSEASVNVEGTCSEKIRTRFGRRNRHFRHRAPEG